jgi:hypothetical protein
MFIALITILLSTSFIDFGAPIFSLAGVSSNSYGLLKIVFGLSSC